MIVDEDTYLVHFGILRRSGRYPWGSGDTIPQRSRSFLDWIKDLRSQGLSDPEIARGQDMSTTELRALNSIALNQHKQAQISQAQALKDTGMSNVAIGKEMGLAESSVRALLVPGAKDKADLLTSTANMLKEQVKEKTYVDVGIGEELHIGISKEKLNIAVTMLKAEDYAVISIKLPQVGTAFDTEYKVLAPPGTTYGEVSRNRSLIRSATNFSEDGGRSFIKAQPPLPVNPKRVSVKHAEDGGAAADGVIYIRPGVKDLSIGDSRYAQVRVQVGDSHFLKGMAMYKDDLPDGVDLQFNTNKKNTGNDLDAMKKLSTKDPDLPFESIVRQRIKDGKVTSAMNIVGIKEGSGAEGSWDVWSKNLASQMLSKQSPALAKEQLAVTFERRQKELNEIMSLTNPTVKKKMLETFADSTDSAAVDLKAAALPRQRTRVLLPVNSLKETEVYAPGFRDGERVALIRYPHGGRFEIPELVVNNRHARAKGLLGDSRDAIGINSLVAQRMSGADFDGDAVVVIPNNSNKVKTSPALEGLKNFDPQASYPKYDGMPKMTTRMKQQEMGKISNLITDMTIKGAPNSDLARAIRHSMVVIDAEKHDLNYKLSAERNGIKQLKAEYQGGTRAGAATLISRAGSETRIPERKARPMKDGGPVDKITGRKVFVETGRMTRAKDGRTIAREQKFDKLAVTDDANLLSSGVRMEKIYADHSNRLKGLANQARLASLSTPPTRYSPSAKDAYATQVDSLNSKLTIAKRNAPRERQANILANTLIRAKRQANPDLDDSTIRKIKYQALTEMRTRTGAGKQRIEITQIEWDAIQAGAISNHRLTQILANADLESVRALATPRRDLLMTSAKTRRAQSMLASGYTRAEVADALGVSLTTLDTGTSE